MHAVNADFNLNKKRIKNSTVYAMASNNNTKSVSEGWREKGNDSYQRVTAWLNPVLRVSRLQDAINSYSRALSTAANNTEKSSACKNMAMAHWKLANSQAGSGEQNPIVLFNYKQALSHFQDAKDYGVDRDKVWIDSLTDVAVRCWFEVSERLSTLETKDRVTELNQTVRYIIDDKTKAREYYELAMHYFHLSVTALGDRDYRKTLSLLKDCYFPLKEAERYGHSDPGLVRECAVLEDDIFTQTSVAESIQERMRGEGMLVHVMREEETLNIDMVWEVVDSFRLAAQLTQERDLEMEAVALSSLGHVYHVVLQLKDRAKACLMKVLELANSMMPRTFTKEGWYEFARSTIEYYQQQTVWAEEERKRKEKEEVLKTMKAEMDALKENHYNRIGFLKFIYATHPPKNPAHKLKEVSEGCEDKEVKKLYQRAIVHYHPDKVDEEEHGKPWKVLTEEITKMLTQHYESMKGF